MKQNSSHSQAHDSFMKRVDGGKWKRVEGDKMGSRAFRKDVDDSRVPQAVGQFVPSCWCGKRKGGYLAEGLAETRGVMLQSPRIG